MAVNEWWSNDEAEIYFLETTDRADIGIDLNAPQTDDAGREHHAYALVSHVRLGDIVFHYQRPHGILAWSRWRVPRSRTGSCGRRMGEWLGELELHRTSVLVGACRWKDRSCFHTL